MNIEYTNILKKSLLYKSKRNSNFTPVCVAILDTGVYSHIDISNAIVGFKDFVNYKSYPYDDNGHGTHIAGIVAGNGMASGGLIHGINDNAAIFGIKVLDKYGNGKINNFIEAIDYIISYSTRYNIRIINISLGSGNSLLTSEEKKLVYFVEKAWTYGITVVVAAGNNGPTPGSITTPGISKKVITVGSCEPFIIDGHKKRFSGNGPTNQCIVKPDIKVPGNDIISLLNTPRGYIKKSGTSMSAPIISGLISILIENNPSITPKEVKKKILKAYMFYNNNKRLNLDVLFN